MKIVLSSKLKSIFLIMTLLVLQAAHPVDQAARLRLQSEEVSSEIQQVNVASQIVTAYQKCVQGILEREQLIRLQKQESSQRNNQEIAKLMHIVEQKQRKCLEEHNALVARSLKGNNDLEEDLAKASDKIVSARSARREQLKSSLGKDISTRQKQQQKASKLSGMSQEQLKEQIEKLKNQEKQLTKTISQFQEKGLQIKKTKQNFQRQLMRLKSSLSSLENKMEEQDKEIQRLKQIIKVAMLLADTKPKIKQDTKPKIKTEKDEQAEPKDTPTQPEKVVPPPTQHIPKKKGQDAPAGQQKALSGDSEQKSPETSGGSTVQAQKQKQPAETTKISSDRIIIPPSSPAAHVTPPKKVEVLQPGKPAETGPLKPSQSPTDRDDLPPKKQKGPTEPKKGAKDGDILPPSEKKQDQLGGARQDPQSSPARHVTRPSTPPPKQQIIDKAQPAPMVDNKQPIKPVSDKKQLKKLRVDTTIPTVDTTQPAIKKKKQKKAMIVRYDTTKPAVDTTKPIVDTTKPAVDTTKPVVDTTKPMADTTKPVVDTTKPVVDTTKPIDDKTTKPTPVASKEQVVPQKPVKAQVVPLEPPVKHLKQEADDQAATTEITIKQVLQQTLKLIKTVEVGGSYGEVDCRTLQSKLKELDSRKTSMDKLERSLYGFITAVNEIKCVGYYQGKQLREMTLRVKSAEQFQEFEQNHSQKLLELVTRIQTKHKKMSKDSKKNFKLLKNMLQSSCRKFISSVQDKMKSMIQNKRGKQREEAQCTQMKELLKVLSAQSKFMSREQNDIYMMLKDQYKLGCV